MENKHGPPKSSWVDPTTAMSYTDKDLIIENIDLTNEIVQFLTDTASDEAEAVEYLKKNGFGEYGPTEFKPEWQIRFEEKQRSVDTQSELVIKQLTNIVGKFREVLTEKISPFGDVIDGYEIMKPDEEIHDALYSLKLYSYGTPYNDNVRKYARYFYSKLIKKSRESALELLLYMEKPPSKQKDPQNVPKGKRDNNKSKSSKRNKAKKKQQLTKDNLPTKNEKENEKSKKADKDAEEYDYGVSASPQDQSNEVSNQIDHH